MLPVVGDPVRPFASAFPTLEAFASVVPSFALTFALAKRALAFPSFPFAFAPTFARRYPPQIQAPATRRRRALHVHIVGLETAKQLHRQKNQTVMGTHTGAAGS